MATADTTMWTSLLHAGLAGSFMRFPHVRPDAAALREHGARAAIYGLPWDLLGGAGPRASQTARRLSTLRGGVQQPERLPHLRLGHPRRRRQAQRVALADAGGQAADDQPRSQSSSPPATRRRPYGGPMAPPSSSTE